MRPAMLLKHFALQPLKAAQRRSLPLLQAEQGVHPLRLPPGQLMAQLGLNRQRQWVACSLVLGADLILRLAPQ